MVKRLFTGWTFRGILIEYRWGRHFPHAFRPAPGTTQPPILFAGGKAAEACRLPPTSYSTEVKERVQLQLHPPLGLHGLFQGTSLFFNLLPRNPGKSEKRVLQRNVWFILMVLLYCAKVYCKIVCTVL
jgi:hypothetical protein